MKLASIVSVTDDTIFGLSLRAQSGCALAKDLEEAGEFEDARRAISEFWKRIGDRPQVEGLDDIARAEVLLRAGALSGWLGSARQLSGAQEIAKDLISESASAFEGLGLVERSAEARIDLAICYWREGSFDEARITLADALQRLGDLDSEQRLRVFLNRALVETAAKQYREALRLCRQAAPMFETSRNHALQGKFHNIYAVVLKNLGLSEHRADYLDQALIEFSAASFHFEQGSHQRHLGVVENNLGFLFVYLGRFQHAHKHLSRARSVALGLKDQGLVAQFDDSRARAFIAEGEFSKAETVARSSVRALEEGDQLSMLSEALTTHGTALARLGSYDKARASFEKAIRTAHNAADMASVGVAALSMAEELASHLPLAELLSYYRMAESELVNSHNTEIQDRLGNCARRIVATEALSNFEKDTVNRQTSGDRIDARPDYDLPAPSDLPTTASLEEQVLNYEGILIKQALDASDGSVTRAARILGVTHQGLAFILNGRHKSLLAARKPVKRRRRSIIRFH
jgi:tetratricopeptide (TPR) repeat protein